MNRILLFSPLDHTDKKAWSGGLYPIWQQLQFHFEEVHTVGPIKTNFLGRVIWKLNTWCDKLFGKKFDDSAVWLMRISLQRRLKKLVKGKDFDAILVVASYGELLALPKTGKPIFFYSDTTQRLFTELYPNRQNRFFNWSNRLQIKLEYKAYSRCSLLVFTSQWAANSAIHEYRQDSNKIKVLSYGANVVPEAPVQRNLPSGNEPVFFLFSAVDWYRKGGDKAVSVITALRTSGINAVLQVAGCEPPLPDADYIQRIGFVNRNTPDGEKVYKRLFEKAHFFLLPTVADCTPFVFCEAFAFGLPVITHDVGGIKDMIEYRNGGLVYETAADAVVMAKDIAAVMADKCHYDQLCMNARESYHQQFNWGHWGNHMARYIKEQLTQHRNSS